MLAWQDDMLEELERSIKFVGRWREEENVSIIDDEKRKR
jgi:hypothetical protein